MKRILSSIALVVLGLAMSQAASAQDFQQSYPMAAGGRVTIQNVSGDIKITGTESTAVIVTGFKEGRDRDMVQIEDLSSGGRVDVKVKYPHNCNNCNASVRFEVQVPRSLNLQLDKISTASGDISIQNVTGDIYASTASGDVQVSGASGRIRASSASGDVTVENASGTVSANTASGDVDVTIGRLEGTGSMKFSSASGDVKLRLPASADAQVNMSTLSGSLKTDFPISIEESEHGPGRRAHGRLGSGAVTIDISTVSGDVSLFKQ